jgi:hypothetical protein
MKLFTLPSLLIRTITLSIIVLCFGGPHYAAAEKFRWQDASQEVCGLRFSQSFIDSLHTVYEVTAPDKPLRITPVCDFFQAETLVYDIGWGPFKAGNVIFTTEPDPVHHTIHVGGKALSNKFVGSFYRMRDYIISTLDEKGLYPLFFEQHLREGKHYQADGWIVYDHVKGKMYVKERSVKTIDAPPLVNDYLSVLYVVRSMHFAPGDTFSLPLFADKKVRPLLFFCRERKTMNRYDDKSVSCLLVEPKLVGDNGAFNKNDKLQVWLSDDERKIPIQIKSKIKVGSITAKLVWASAPRPKPPAPVQPAVSDTTPKATTTLPPTGSPDTMPKGADTVSHTGSVDSAQKGPDSVRRAVSHDTMHKVSAP